MKRFVVGMLRSFLNARYKHHCKKPRANRILFVSRQSNGMSADFRLLREEIELNHPDWEVATCIKMLDGGLKAKIDYAFHMLDEVKQLAQCRICFVEGYNPALSLLDLECVELGGTTRNNVAPTAPVVMQVWHASGMYKKFGFLATGTGEGRSEEEADLFCMHRNYSWIVTSGEAARQPYADALGYPVERTVALGRPTCDILHREDAQALERAIARYPELEGHPKPVILFAPTLHRTQEKTSFDILRETLEANPQWSDRFNLIWSYHPVLTPGDKRRVPTGMLLRCADILVTDYSSIVYDAELLGVPTAFYVPDINEYRESPGLITDPSETSPGICLNTPKQLMDFVDGCVEGKGYPQEELDSFIGESLSACQPGSAQRIVDFAIEQAQAQA